MDLIDTCIRPEAVDVSTPKCARGASLHISRRTSWGTPIPPPSSQKDAANLFRGEIFDDVELSTGTELERGNTLDNIAAIGLSFKSDGDESSTNAKHDRFSLDDDERSGNEFLPINSDKPFNKWVRSLQRRAIDRRQTVSGDCSGSGYENEFFESTSTSRPFSHKKSSSGSSFGFVTAIKSASISLASFSVAPRSKRTAVSSYQQRTDLSSRASNHGRVSEDSSYISRGLFIDQAVTNRLLQRRRVLEELITTEESYVADLKFLMNVYVTLLAAIPTLSFGLRASINRNLNEIVELHEELLGGLHRAVPHSEYTQLPVPEVPTHTRTHAHTRWRSLDAGTENVRGAAWLQKIPGMTAEPKIAAEAAKVFAKKISLFFVYEEYGAKYDFMIKDVATAYKTMPQWENYQKGLETLASSLASINSQQGNSKKASTIGDLLVKPIQRVCKYPLLFAELLKQTPVCDCPDSHMEIENVLIRLREATTEINRATDDPRMKVTMEKTWLLQDRLSFKDMPGVRSQNSIRTLGHIHLCGVLYVSWQTSDGVDGQYLICLLYRDFLLLASASRSDQLYKVQACIGLAEIHVEEIDNGRGLQCHTAPFSWKIVFEVDHYLYEMAMSACSPKEELEWRSRIIDRSFKGNLSSGELALFTSLLLPAKAMGQVFGKPGTIARRISIHRATTVGSNAGRCQVIIQNTNAFKETASCASIIRSQSLLATNRIPVLAPPRAERIRIENLLSDVWTREILPYPGMTGRSRGEHLVRTSASSMMRKLSVASITSNFTTKRSGSMASLHRFAEDSESGEHIEDVPIRATLSRPEKYPSGEPCKPGQAEKLLAIPDEKDQGLHRNSVDNLHDLINDSPASTLHRLATFQASKNWSHDGQRIVTPPLRTSSTNQQRPTTPRPAVTELGTPKVGEDKENLKGTQIPHTGPASTPTVKESKQGKREKGRQLVVGALNFFR